MTIFYLMEFCVHPQLQDGSVWQCFATFQEEKNYIVMK